MKRVIIFTIIFIAISQYMKTRLGLKPEEYSKEERKYDELKEIEKEAEIITSLKNTEQVSISTRILRAETAAISTCTIILYEMEG